MKKVLALVLALAMVFSLAACGGGSDDKNADSSASCSSGSSDSTDYSETSIAIVLAGSINDNGWNAAGYNAAKAIADEYGCQFAYSENVATSDCEEFIRGYATQGFKMIIVHGSQYIDYVKNVAPEFEDSQFIISYGDADESQSPNVSCVGNIDSGFLAGYIAATVSKENKVGFLGGEESPSITPIVERFEDGAKYANPDCEVITGYIGSLTDADKAKEVANNTIAQGVDVIGASANAAGLGVIQAAQEAGIMDIGFNSDQYDNAPDTVIVSVLRDFQAMYTDVFKQIAEGTFESGLYQYGIGTGAIISDWHGWDEKLDAEDVQAIEDFIAGCADGSIDISNE